MATSRHRAPRLRRFQRRPTFIHAAAPAPDTRQRPAVPTGRGGAALHQLRQGLTTIGALGAGSSRPAATWRPLIRFWLMLLAVAAAACGVLDYLGPPARRSAEDLEASGGRGQVVEAEQAAAGVPPPGQGFGRQTTPEALAAGEVSPSDARPASDGPTPATPRRLTVFHAAESTTAAAVVQRLMSHAGLAADTVGAEPAAISSPRADIRFYSVDDHALARRIGRELGRMGYPWQIENLSALSEQRGVEVWLPSR